MIFWDGQSSDDLMVRVEHYPALPRPARRMSRVSVPGRNGDLIFDEGAYENYTQPYDIYLSAERRRLPGPARAVAAWLLAPAGYQRLEDSYEPDFYRMASFDGPLDLANILNRFGRATIEFSCKPQRYFKGGERAVELTAPGTPLHNPYAFAALPLITVYGSGPGNLQVGSTTVQIKALEGSLTLDSEIQDAYKGTQNKNNTIFAPEFPALAPGDNAVSWTGEIERVEIVPRWWTL